MKDVQIDIRINSVTYDELSAKEQQLINAAKDATKNSYAPYSHFSVGAAALLDNDVIVTGSNQENAAYPSGICAERTTLFYANSQYPDSAVRALAVAAWTEGDFLETPIPPCGACRQVLLETEKRFGTTMRILLFGKKEIYVMEGVKNLLPLSFTTEYLAK
ncbi:cytidine deaminase [Bacteroides heparinolyticus]|uniref:cytidine deaminase n=1 Tax=Prevotella heparinolytica TaxID=28113 RepID=UPI00359F8E39